jgi:hypothetical protein
MEIIGEEYFGLFQQFDWQNGEAYWKSELPTGLNIHGLLSF